MINKIFFRLVLFLFFAQCSNINNNHLNKGHKQHFGIIISNSTRHGRPNSFFNISTTFTNDTLIPVHLKISFSNEYVYDNQKFKILLLPESMTVEKLRNPDFFNSEVQKFLQLQNPISINKIIDPKENYIVNIAFFNECNSNFFPTQFAIISNLHKFNFTSIHDSLIMRDNHSNDSLNISLGLNFGQLTNSVYGFKLIPCGKVYYANE